MNKRMRDVEELIRQTEPIGVSDESALGVPRMLVEQYGEGVYPSIANLLGNEVIDECPQLFTVVENLGAFSDGVSPWFLNWCNAGGFLSASLPTQSSIFIGCLRWNSIWRQEDYYEEMAKFLDMSEPFDASHGPRMRSKGIYSCQRKRQQAWETALKALKLGQISVPDGVIAEFVDQDSTRGQNRIGLDIQKVSEYRKAIAMLWCSTKPFYRSSRPPFTTVSQDVSSLDYKTTQRIVAFYFESHGSTACEKIDFEN